MKSSKIIVTGSAGFIGSHVARHFTTSYKNTSLVDKLDLFSKHSYLKDLTQARFYSANPEKLEGFTEDLDLVIHMGAITNTAETDQRALDLWNTDYTKMIWNFCSLHSIPLIYASSAATYGDGEQGFSDDHKNISRLKPLNLYGLSKQKFDLWSLEQSKAPPLWYGLKFFNVYGPCEAHKGRMASAVFHGFNEIQKTGKMTLFRSHHPDYKDGEQARDFIFINDILKIMDFLLDKKPASGIYNCGTGKAQAFRELSSALFSALDKKEDINWIDTPLEFRKAYQYKTQANMTKLFESGFKDSFTQLPFGISKYIKFLTELGPSV